MDSLSELYFPFSLTANQNPSFFKAAVRTFILFVAISVKNLVLQPGVELSLLRGLFSDKASARMTLMF